MKSGLLAVLAYLAVASLSVYRTSHAARSAADLAAVEAAVRKADAEWAVAARTVSVDAWMAFYAADAVVLLPHDQLANGKEVLRHSVSRLLAMPRSSLARRPTKVVGPPPGEQALLINA